MDVEAYLARLVHRGGREPSAATLRALHRAHLEAVPFENLDVIARRPIVLEPAALFAKIVAARRGGFCFELNGLFAELLVTLGFRVQRYAAQVWSSRTGRWGIPFDHMALAVVAEDGSRWLADVGFGDSFLEPLPLGELGRDVHDADGRTYRVVEHADERVLERAAEGAWEPQYRFAERAWELGDFDEGARHHSTSPESHFTHGRVCSRATPGGRVTLSERRLIVTASGVREERVLATEGDVRRALAEHFGVVLGGASR